MESSGYQRPLQSDIERIIAKRIPDYNYGLRRQDPTSVIENSGLFDNVEHLAESFIVQMKREKLLLLGVVMIHFFAKLVMHFLK